jgi:repressor LexA
MNVHMNTMGTTDRRQALVDFFRDLRAAKGLMLLLREIQGDFRFASSHAAPKHVQALEKKGAIQKSGGAARSVKATGMVQVNLLRIPLLGMIPAGYPSDQEQQSDRCLSIDEDTLQLPKNARTFALEVRGDSMIDAHIMDGDVVIMELRDPTHRDIVAALIDGETTLKRFLVQKGKPFLRAENSKYPDLIPAHELVIQGVFRALLRVDKRRL